MNFPDSETLPTLLRGQAALLGVISKPTICKLIAKEAFPRPVKITATARAWKLSEIVAWVDSREQGARHEFTNL